MATEYTVICLYLFFGACFGFVTYNQRHLFSEGPHKAKESDEVPFLESRIFWVLLCASLWPIMVITRIYTAWLLFKRKKQSQK